ncbi:MAG: hypothetical protein OQK82_02565 [Candidatus Pacearchaeota archaeon]|nr:hypothetical protein [Candidatus Pacearchaeota archaeon]
MSSRILVILAMLLYSLSISAENRLFQSTYGVLSGYHNNSYKIISRGQYFYGYGFIDNNRAFIASQPNNFEEAIAVLEIYDFKTNEKHKILEVGGVGESNFDINPSNGSIIFNDSEGLKIMKIDTKNNASINTIIKSKIIVAPFWVNGNEVGYTELGKGFSKIKIK